MTLSSTCPRPSRREISVTHNDVGLTPESIRFSLITSIFQLGSGLEKSGTLYEESGDLARIELEVPIQKSHIDLMIDVFRKKRVCRGVVVSQVVNHIKILCHPGQPSASQICVSDTAGGCKVAQADAEPLDGVDCCLPTGNHLWWSAWQAGRSAGCTL